MTRDAQDALARAGLSRRAFLGGCGAIIVGFTVAEGPGGRGKVSAQGRAAASTELDAWLAVGTDGTVTAYTGKCELGQGLLTAQTQLIAEELAVPVSRVRLIQCDTARTPTRALLRAANRIPPTSIRRTLPSPPRRLAGPCCGWRPSDCAHRLTG